MIINELCFRKITENGSKTFIDKAVNYKNNSEPNSLNVLILNELSGLTAF